MNDQLELVSQSSEESCTVGFNSFTIWLRSFFVSQLLFAFRGILIHLYRDHWKLTKTEQKLSVLARKVVTLSLATDPEMRQFPDAKKVFNSFAYVVNIDFNTPCSTFLYKCTFEPSFYQQCLAASKEIAEMGRLKYLQWIYETNGIKAVRKQYKRWDFALDTFLYIISSTQLNYANT